MGRSYGSHLDSSHNLWPLPPLSDTPVFGFFLGKRIVGFAPKSEAGGTQVIFKREEETTHNFSPVLALK